MQFILTIECGNAAFADDYREYEIRRILEDVVNRLRNGAGFPMPLRDINGNTVGTAVIEGEEND